MKVHLKVIIAIFIFIVMSLSIQRYAETHSGSSEAKVENIEQGEMVAENK